MTLADRCEAVLAERGPLSGGALAAELQKRRVDVFTALHSDARFQRTGKRRASRWSVAASAGYTVDELAARWGCDRVMASEILLGLGGFLERGFVSNGDGRFRVTRRGLEAAALVKSLA